MDKLEFKLMQHTPIIHFQTNVKGATIRPTEFKAKLDKYFIGKWTGCYGLKDDRLNALWKNPSFWKFVKNGYDFSIDIDPIKNKKPSAPALDYKIEIAVNNSDQNDINGKELQLGEEFKNDFKLFFGNMGNNNPIKKKFSYHNQIIVTIKSTNQELLRIINQEISLFLFNVNFGTRQNKGFGSFFLNNSIHSEIIDKESINNHKCYKFKVDVSNLKELEAQKKLFKYIDFLYRTMRSGINRNGLYYIKPTIWHYLKDKDYQWDKKTIKEHFYASEIPRPITRNHASQDSPIAFSQTKPETEKYLWRDLLGFSAEQEWRSYTDKHVRKILNKSTEKELKRFTAPITFKPLRKDANTFVVFILLNGPFADDAKKEEHELKNFPFSEIFSKQVEISNKSLTIPSLPFPETFDYYEFLKESFKLTYFDLKIKGDDSNPDLKIVKNIFSQLNSQNPY